MTQTTLPAIPTQEQLSSEANPILETAQAFVIDSPEMYEIAGDELRTIKAKAKALEDRRKAITGPMDKAKKEVMDLFRKPLEVLEKAEGALKRTMLGYQQQEREKAAQAQREAEAAAAAERAKVEEQAREAEAKGDVATAAALQTAATVMTAAPIAVAEPAKLSGITTTTRWSAEVVDKTAYIRHVLDNAPELIDTIEVTMKPLNQMAVALKDKLNIPGIKAVATEGIAARA